MKVAILTPTFSKFSGPDRVVMNEAEELTAKGDDVTVITFRTDFEEMLLQKKGINVEVLGMPKMPMLERLYRLLFFLDIPKALKIAKMARGYDWAISFLYPMTLPSLIAKMKQKKLKYTYYDVGVAYSQLFESLPEKLYMMLFSFLTKLTIKNADNAISISKFLSSELKKQTGIQSEVKYVRIDHTRFNNRVSSIYKKDIEAIVEKHKPKKPILLYVGRLSPHKGIHLLLEAFQAVKQTFPEATLILVGKQTFPKYAQELKKKASEIGGVVFTDFVPDEKLPAYYAICDVYVTASMWEGFNIPLCDANACGKPAVAFRIGSHQEVLKKGTLVEPGNTKEFAETVIKELKK